MTSDNVAVRTTALVTGVVAVRHLKTQELDEEIGRPRIEFWCPERRPEGGNLAVSLDPPLRPFGVQNVRNGYAGPASGPNAWVANPDDSRPTINVRWPQEQRITRVELSFDTDFDDAMESVLYRIPNRPGLFACATTPCVRVESSRWKWLTTIRPATPTSSIRRLRPTSDVGDPKQQRGRSSGGVRNPLLRVVTSRGIGVDSSPGLHCAGQTPEAGLFPFDVGGVEGPLALWTGEGLLGVARRPTT
jgi:hypothetical protein